MFTKGIAFVARTRRSEDIFRPQLWICRKLSNARVGGNHKTLIMYAAQMLPYGFGGIEHTMRRNQKVRDEKTSRSFRCTFAGGAGRSGSGPYRGCIGLKMPFMAQFHHVPSTTADREVALGFKSAELPWVGARFL